MCLYFNPKTQEEQIKQLFGDKQEIVVYKRLRVYTTFDYRYRLSPPTRGGHVETEKGFYVSDRPSKEITENPLSPNGKRYDAIDHGIHVYLQEHICESQGHILVKSIAYKDDLVAISKDDKEAVFMKIKLPKKIIKKYNTEPTQLACEHLIKLTLLIAALAVGIVLLVALFSYILSLFLIKHS